jgi:cell division protein FtsB
MNLTRVLFWALGLSLFFMLARLWVGQGSYPEIWHLQQQIQMQTADNVEKTARNNQLKLDVAGLDKDSSVIEEHARNELGMIKQNETFYQVILKSDIQDSTAHLPQPVRESAHVE